jgi:hypothetical protein
MTICIHAELQLQGQLKRDMMDTNIKAIQYMVITKYKYIWKVMSCFMGHFCKTTSDCSEGLLYGMLDI